MRKTAIRSGAIVSAVLAASVGCFPSRDIASTSSPDGKYTVTVTQERPLPGVERHVYLNASRAGEPMVRRKLLYTGDLLDDGFRSLYPTFAWTSPSVLKIGQMADTGNDTLQVANESSRRLTYLLIETHRDKYVVLDFESRAAITVRFDYIGQLSAEGQTQDSGMRLADAVVLPGVALTVENAHFSVQVRENALTIDGPPQLQHVTCCAVDRPSAGHD